MKNIFLLKMICFDIYGVNIYVSKHKFNSFEKNKLYSYDFRWFSLNFFHEFGWFFATRIRFIEADPDPDPADQNETDPNGSGSGSATLEKTKANFLFKINGSLNWSGWEILVYSKIDVSLYNSYKGLLNCRNLNEEKFLALIVFL